MLNLKKEEIVARSVKIEPLGEPERCHDAENSKFWCLKVKIIFDNGEEREFVLRGYSEPKEIENFLQNKKGIRDILEKSYVLLKNGEVRLVYPSPEEQIKMAEEEEKKKRQRRARKSS